jgi:hypothetical protein
MGGCSDEEGCFNPIMSWIVFEEKSSGNKGDGPNQ